jgi:eukaryotic-like serine/threonine-protein kinase
MTAETFSREFRFDACVGAGGHASVYRAREFSSGLRRTVAIKLLHSQTRDKDEIRRLRAEALILGDVDHTAILKVYSLSELDGRIALVTEYIDGQDLRQCIHGRNPINTRAMLEAMDLVADGLHTAWDYTGENGVQRKVVHRDIKPSNLRISRKGTPKILDFGIAKSAEYTGLVAAKTATGNAIGTILYMSPERFAEEPLGPAVDVWACGAILYEGLAKRRLYDGLEPTAIYFRSLNVEQYEEFVEQRLAAVPESANPLLVEQIALCLSFDPADRPTAAQLSEMCRELADHLTNEPSLRQWASGRHWPDEDVSEEDALVGVTLTDGALTLRPNAGSPAWEAPVPEAESKPGSWIWLRASMAGIGVFVLVLMAGGVAMGTAGLALWSQQGAEVDSPVPASVPLPTTEPAMPVETAPEPAAEKVAEVVEEPQVDAPPIPEEKRGQPVTSKPAPQVAAAQPRPSAEPAAAPVTLMGRVRGEVDVPVELRGPTTLALRGDAMREMPVGDYEVFADFGSGPTSWGSLTVTETLTRSVRCRSMLAKCTLK